MTEQLGRNRDRLEALLGVIDEAVLVVGPEQRVLRCTPGTLAWLHAANLEGRALNELFPSDLFAGLAPALDRAQVEARAQQLQLELRPERMPAWRSLGLRESQRMLLRVVAVEGGWLLVLRDAGESQARSAASQTQRDPLTGAYSRRAFMPVISQSLAQAQRYDWPCSVMMVDIDGFGAINERYGLDTGDRLLRAFVDEMLAKKRGSDFFARYENDSFVMFMPETNLEQGLLAAARVRRLAAGLDVETPDGKLPFTLSIGVSALTGAEDSVEALMTRVGENLYVARQCGGDRSEGDG